MRPGGAIVLFLAAAALAGCKKEPSFDERYASAQKAIRDKAADLDRDMGQRARQSQGLAAEPSSSGSETPQVPGPRT